MDLEISQGEAKQKRPGLFEPKASFQDAAERALEISQIHAHAGSNAGDGCKKLRKEFIMGDISKVVNMTIPLQSGPVLR